MSRPFFGSSPRKMRSRPSGDQQSAYCDDDGSPRNNGRSSPPADDFSVSVSTPEWSSLNATRAPSGDQTGEYWLPRVKLKRRGTPSAAPATTMWFIPSLGSNCPNAIFDSSGESEIPSISPGAPRAVSGRPSREYQARRVFTIALRRYASTPEAEAESGT